MGRTTYIEKKRAILSCAYSCAQCGEINIEPNAVETTSGTTLGGLYHSVEKEARIREELHLSAGEALAEDIMITMQKVNSKHNYEELSAAVRCAHCGARQPWAGIKCFPRWYAIPTSVLTCIAVFLLIIGASMMLLSLLSIGGFSGMDDFKLGAMMAACTCGLIVLLYGIRHGLIRLRLLRAKKAMEGLKTPCHPLLLTVVNGKIIPSMPDDPRVAAYIKRRAEAFNSYAGIMAKLK